MATVPLFSRCGRGELSKIAKVADEIDLRPGKVLTQQGARGREFFIILEGSADVRQNERALKPMGPGDFLGEIALIDHGRRTASATAETDCRLLVLGHREFHSLLDAQPDIRVHVLEALARRVRQLTPEHEV